jgi:hypothetical protein
MNNCRIHVVKVILDFQGRGLVSIIFLTWIKTDFQETVKRIPETEKFEELEELEE